jgi:hypothetical protein
MARQRPRVQLDSADMANDVQMVIRVPQTLAARVKEYAEQLSKEVGVPVSVAAATRKLLVDAIETLDKPQPRPKR